MTLEDLEHRIRTLEIRMVIHSRIISMLAWYTAMEVESASHLVVVSDAIKDMSHKDFRDSRDQEIFLEYKNRAADILKKHGKQLEDVLQKSRKNRQKMAEADLREKVGEILDSTHFEVLPVRTITEN